MPRAARCARARASWRNHAQPRELQTLCIPGARGTWRAPAHRGIERGRFARRSQPTHPHSRRLHALLAPRPAVLAPPRTAPRVSLHAQRGRAARRGAGSTGGRVERRPAPAGRGGGGGKGNNRPQEGLAGAGGWREIVASAHVSTRGLRSTRARRAACVRAQAGDSARTSARVPAF